MTPYDDIALRSIDLIARQHLTMLITGVGKANYLVDMDSPMGSLFRSEWLFKNFLETADNTLELNGNAVKLDRNNTINDLIAVYVKANDTDERAAILTYPFLIDTEAFYSKHPEKKFTFAARGDYAPFDIKDLIKLAEHLWTTNPRVGADSVQCGVVNYDFIHYWNSRAPAHMQMNKQVIYIYDKDLPYSREGEIAVTKRKDGLATIITDKFQIRHHHNLWMERLLCKSYPDKFTPLAEFGSW